MSTASRFASRRLLAVLVIALALTVAGHTLLDGGSRWSWPPKACEVQGVTARCGTFVVPEDRARPNGPTIGLDVVVLPAFLGHRRVDAVTYLAGGPGVPVIDETADLSEQLNVLNGSRDILLVDQRGTGRSRRHGGDVTQYGTGAAMDDLDAVRAALGYRRLDVIGGSYGATAAQVYLVRHPASVRTLILSGATAIDVPFFAHYAVGAQRSLDSVARLCALDRDCRTAFPGWEPSFRALVKAWNVDPVHGTTGDKLASVVHVQLLDGTKAVSIPLIVSSAANGDLGPLEHAGPGDLHVELNLMAKSIWCNEPWAGLDARGPWGTAFDSYTTAKIAAFRDICSSVARRAEPRELWTLPVRSSVPVLVLAGGADPQDPLANLGDLKRHFPDSRTIVLPHVGHSFGIGGCLAPVMSDFVDRATTRGLDSTPCLGSIIVPPFAHSG